MLTPTNKLAVTRLSEVFIIFNSMRLQFNSKIPYRQAQHGAAHIVFLNRSLAITVPGKMDQKKGPQLRAFL
jgi:hypothetical protein